MKRLLLIATITAMPLLMHAQITLDINNAPSVAQCQTNDTLRNVEVNSLPDLTPKANGTWDLTAAVDSYGFHTYNSVIASSNFPSANFSVEGLYLFAAGQSYQLEQVYGVNSMGIIRYGEQLDYQALPIGTLTGDNGDSLVFITQDITYDALQHEIKYPATMNSTWTDNVRFVTKFNLTVKAFGINNTPGERVTYRTIKNTVKGWGKMRIKDEQGNPTAYMDVLVLEKEAIATDSFYLGGSPAPPALLTAFSLTQGQQTADYRRYFLRANEYRGLAEVYFDGANFNNIQSVAIQRRRLKPTGIDNIEARHISVFPNPVTKSTLTVKLGVPYNQLQYELISMTGQTVQYGTVPQDGTIQLNDQLPGGNYIINIETEKGTKGAKRINIIR